VTGGARRPALAANARRNAAGGLGRAWRWRGTRDSAWTLLERHVPAGAAVAVVGAGNGHDLPLRRLGRRAGRLDLIDVDSRALARTRRRLRLSGVRAGAITQDVTHGAADLVLRSALAGHSAGHPFVRAAPIGRPPYDVVIADMFLSQLLYPALSDAGVTSRAVTATLRAHGQTLTNTTVAGLAAAAPGGVLIVIEDLLGWWAGHDQPFALADVLALDPEAALAKASQGRLARGCDGRRALEAAGAKTLERAFWHWPFSFGTDYLVCATVSRTPRPSGQDG
jgi:hypothetical protein